LIRLSLLKEWLTIEMRSLADERSVGGLMTPQCLKREDYPMNSFRFPLSCQLFLALVVATSLASGVAEARSPGSVPLKATIAITESIQTIGTPPCILIGDISGTGTATHLGKVTLVSSDCINPISETAFSFSSKQLVVTAANGDQVFAMYSGILAIEGTVGVITGAYQIVGGTGKFSQATGAGTVHGVEDISTGEGQIQLTGTISY
jgi:hypothetical protein